MEYVLFSNSVLLSGSCMNVSVVGLGLGRLEVEEAPLSSMQFFFCFSSTDQRPLYVNCTRPNIADLHYFCFNSTETLLIYITLEATRLHCMSVDVGGLDSHSTMFS